MIDLKSIERIGYPEVSGLCEAAYLDLPKQDGVLPQDIKELRFYGWVVSNQFYSELKIRLVNGSKRTDFMLNKVRNDVVLANKGYTGSAKCGFAINLLLSSDSTHITLSIVVGDKEFPWYALKFQPSTLEAPLAANPEAPIAANPAAWSKPIVTSAPTSWGKSAVPATSGSWGKGKGKGKRR